MSVNKVPRRDRPFFTFAVLLQMSRSPAPDLPDLCTHRLITTHSTKVILVHLILCSLMNKRFIFSEDIVMPIQQLVEMGLDVLVV